MTPDMPHPAPETMPPEAAAMLRHAAQMRDMVYLDQTLETVRRRWPKHFKEAPPPLTFDIPKL